MLKNIWDNLEERFLVVSFIVAVAIVFFQVVMRYVFQNSQAWTEELARYIFLWQIWIGASYGTKKSRQLRIEMLKDKLSKVNRIYLEMFVLTLWLIFSIFLSYKGIELTSKIAKVGQVSPAIRMPMQYAYASVPAGCILMSVRIIEHFIYNLKALRKAREV